MSGSVERLYMMLLDARVRVSRVMAVRLRRRTWRTWLMLLQAEAWKERVEEQIQRRRAELCAKSQPRET